MPGAHELAHRNRLLARDQLHGKLGADSGGERNVLGRLHDPETDPGPGQQLAPARRPGGEDDPNHVAVTRATAASKSRANSRLMLAP